MRVKVLKGRSRVRIVYNMPKAVLRGVADEFRSVLGAVCSQKGFLKGRTRSCVGFSRPILSRRNVPTSPLR